MSEKTAAAPVAAESDASGIERAREALKESERKYREVADRLAEGVFEADTRGTVTYANLKVLSSLGFTEDDIEKGLNVFDVIAPQSMAEAKERFAGVLNKIDVGAGEYTLKRKDGTTFPALVHSLAVVREGRVVGVRGILVDITERKQAENALKESERRYRELADLLDEGVFETDRAGRITYSNRKGMAYLGFGESDLESGINVFDIIVPENAALLRERLARLLRGEDIGAVEYTVKRKDGKTFPALIHSSAIFKGDEVEGVRGVLFDMSEIKRTEDALKASEERFATLLKSLHEGVWALDKDDRTTFVNPRMAEMLGYTEAEMLGQPVYAFADEEWEKFTSEAMERRRQGMSEQLDVKLKRKDGGHVCVLIEASPIIDPSGAYAGSIAGVQDITERKIAEARQHRIMAELDRSNKELEQFAYVTSHDLREPLRMMTSFAQSLEKRYKGKLDGAADEYIHFIVDGASRMQRLIDDILLYSRVGTRGLPFERVEMDRVLEEVLLDLKTAVDESGGRITHDPLPAVQADPSQMKQILQNLIGNALKFHREGEPPAVHVSAAREGREWVFSVRDNGIGIDPELFGKLFNLFQRLHPPDKYPGTGVGLAVTKKIAQRHGGRTWVESQPGKGSVFHFSLPVAARADKNESA